MAAFFLFVASLGCAWHVGSVYGRGTSLVVLIIEALISGVLFAAAYWLVRYSEYREVRTDQDRKLRDLSDTALAYEQKYGVKPSLSDEFQEKLHHHAHMAQSLGDLVGGSAGGWAGVGAVAAAHAIKGALDGVKRFFSTSPEQRAHQDAIDLLAFEVAENESAAIMFWVASVVGAVLVAACFSLAAIR